MRDHGVQMETATILLTVGLCLLAILLFSVYRRLGPVAGLGDVTERLEELRQTFDLPTSLAQLGVSRSSITEMAKQAERQWTGGFNPVPLTTEAATGIYESSL